MMTLEYCGQKNSLFKSLVLTFNVFPDSFQIFSLNYKWGADAWLVVSMLASMGAKNVCGNCVCCGTGYSNTIFLT
jgi:hypothetical protein